MNVLIMIILSYWRAIHHYNNGCRFDDEIGSISDEEENYNYEDYYNYYENNEDDKESDYEERSAEENNEDDSDGNESYYHDDVDYYDDDEGYENDEDNPDYGEEYYIEGDETYDCEGNVDDDEPAEYYDDETAKFYDDEYYDYDEDYENPEHYDDDYQEHFNEEGEPGCEETGEVDGFDEDEYYDYENEDYDNLEHNYDENQEYCGESDTEDENSVNCFNEGGSGSCEEDGQCDYDEDYLQIFDDEDYYVEDERSSHEEDGQCDYEEDYLQSLDEYEEYEIESYEEDSSHEDNWDYELVNISDAKQSDLLHKFIFRLYEHLNAKLRSKFSVSPDAIKLATKKLMFNYKNLNQCGTPEVLNFDDKAICLGYLHRYAICHLGLVYRSILKTSLGSTSFLSSLPCDELNVVCLGSGPGNDFFGFVFALDDSYVNGTFIDVTLVDVNVGWEAIFSETVATVKKISNGKFKKLRENFIQADITDSSSWDYNMRKKMKRADVITLVKVLSCIRKDDHLETLKNIIGLMKDDAFLIIIDCPLPSVELSALQNFLYPVYSSSREKFNFKEKKTRFGYPNISQCTAYIRVYKKRNSSQFT